jgi:hypothetical protein
MPTATLREMAVELVGGERVRLWEEERDKPLPPARQLRGPSPSRVSMWCAMNWSAVVKSCQSNSCSLIGVG